MGPLERCGFCFSGKAAFQHHTEAHHIPRYECPLCDHRFQTTSFLRRHHIAVHSELKEFKCNLCEYATSQKCNLKRHMERKNHRKESDEEWLSTGGYKKGHKCEICYRTYPYPSKLRYHMRFAHGEQKPFKCNLCDYTTEQKGHLKRHLQLHEHRDKSMSNNPSVERSRTSTNVNGTDACDPPQEEDVETFTVDRPLRNLPSTVQLGTANRKNDESPVVEKKRSTRKTEEESEDPAPSCTSNNIVVDSSHHSENVEFVEMRDNLICATSPVEPSQRFSFRPALATPIYEEARKLKSEVLSATTLPVVLSLLERLLDLSASIMHQIRSSMEVEARHEAIESFEYVWGASKIAVGRWGDMVESSMDRNTFLKAHKAVQYAYEILPVFVSLEINEHLKMVENVMLLALNTVKNCQHPSSIEQR